MWKKRACSILLAFMVAITAIPFSALPVYSQEVGQDAAEAQAPAGSVETEAADTAVPEQDASDEEATEPSDEESLQQETETEETDDETVEFSDVSEEEVSPDETSEQETTAPAEDVEASEEEAEESDESAESAGDAADEDVTDDAADEPAAAGGTDAGAEETVPAEQETESTAQDAPVTAEPAAETVSETASEQGTMTEGIRIWFEIDDTRIYSDGTYTFELQTEGFPEDPVWYNASITVGTFSDDGTISEEFTSGEEYDFDGKNLTLYGDKIYAKGVDSFGYKVYASASGEGMSYNAVSTRKDLESREVIANYDFADDKDMLTGWYATVNHWERVYVENADHPDGIEMNYETTDVYIESQDPAESGKDVLDIRREYPGGDTSSDDYWWHYEAGNTGTAVMHVDYKDIYGDAQSYTFEVYVKGDVYGVDASTEDGSTVTRPGGTINLVTEAWRHSEDPAQEGNIDDLVYTWNLKPVDGSPDPDTFASIKPAADGKTASVTFSESAGLGEDQYELDVEVFIYTGPVSEENKVGYDCERLRMSNEYTELWPTGIDSDAGIGSKQTITAEYRIYPGTDDQEYDLVTAEKGSVYYYWYYDSNAFTVYDKDGKEVGNRDESGTYMGSDASSGSACDFTIYRKKPWDTQLMLAACWTDTQGQEHWEERQYHIDQKYVAAWIDCKDNRIFNDGTASYPVSVEGLSEGAVYGTDYNIDLKIGPLGDNGITSYFTEGTEYTFDGSTITFDGEKLAAFGLENDQMIGSDLALLIGEEEVASGNCDFRYREAWIDYDFERDRDMLPEWDGTVNGSYYARVENSTYPDGWDFNYQVTNAEIVSDNPADGETGPVIKDFHRDENPDDPSDYWWYYRVGCHGTAVFKVDFEDIDGKAQSYTFEVYVKKDIYEVNVSAEDGSTITRPGGTINLVTDVRHESEDESRDGVTDNLVYEWNLNAVDGNPDPADFAVLQTAADGKTASVAFSAPEGYDGRQFELDAEVSAYADSAAEENLVGSASVRLRMADDYSELWPAKIDSSMDAAQSQSVTAQFRLYPGSDGQEYDLITPERGTVTYYWYYDENALAIYDKDGKQVGNDDESGSYKGSDASTGPSCEFTIYRKNGWDTDLSLNACWTDQNGEEHWESCHYDLMQKDYDIWVDIEDDRIFSDASASFPVAVNGFADGAVYGTDYKIDLKIGPQGDDGISDPFTDGTEYTFDGSTLTLDGEKIAAVGLDNDQMIEADFTLLAGEEEVWNGQWYFRYREAWVDYDFENDRDMLPGWDGGVNGTYRARVQNSTYPDGQDFDYHVTNVEIVSDNPADGGEGPVIDDFHRDENPDDASDYWWYYHVNCRGTAVLKVTFEDIDGQEQGYTFSLNVTDDVYNVWIDSEDNRGNVLAGDSLSLQANGVHQYYDENGEYQEDSEGLGYSWSLVYGSEWASIEPDPADSSKATLVCKEKPADMDWLNENVMVGVRVLDSQGEETNGYNNRDFWVRSEYTEIWPTELNQDLDLGPSIENQKFEVRYYSLDQDNYEVLDDKFDVRYEWYYDQNAFRITETKDTGTAEVVPGEAAGTNTFTFTRLNTWRTEMEVRAVWSENGEERDCHCNYGFGDKIYKIRFENDDDTIRNDEKKSFAVNTEGLGELDCEILFIVNYQSGEDAYTDMTMGQEYTVDASGTSVTVDGALADQLISTSTVNPDEFYIGAGILYQGNLLENSIRWSRVRMERAEKQEQEISASDITMTMYDTKTASVEGAQGTLTFTSGNTDVVTVNAETGELTTVSAGTAQITVQAAETDQYKAASATFTVTVEKLDVSDATVNIYLPREGFTYDGTSHIPPRVDVIYNNITLVEGTDYTIQYADTVNAGTKVRMAVLGTGNCTGRNLRQYPINRASQSFTVKAAAYSIYAGNTTRVTASGAKETTQYTFSSSNNAIATINAAGTVTGKTGGSVNIVVRTAATKNYLAGVKQIKINVVLKKPGNCHFVKWNNSKYTSCQIAWNATPGAEGYQTLLSWTDGSHASTTIVKANVRYRNCSVVANHVSQMKVRAFCTVNGKRQFGPWSNVEYITPSPAKLTVKNVSKGSNLQEKVSWNIIYGCNGYNVFITTNPNGKWYWNQSTSQKATATSAVINKCGGSKLKKNTRYYVRIVTRRKRNGVFCTVPMPASNTYVGSFVIK